MDDDLMRMRELKAQGFFCSQILMILALELRGEDNPHLVRAAHGLAGGIGFAGELCGALTGAGALLGLYAGKGTPEEEDDPRLLFMAEDLVKWFKGEYGPQFGGIRCTDIVEGNQANQATRCPAIVAATLQKVKELLVENGFDLSGMDRG
jgi:C_GCAxxG_C_C family probable redox protein